MHVTRVELENIKSYDRAEYDFERGTTAIVGANGAGKTTILEAIAWTLFDTLEYSKDDFLRRGAKKGWVRVTFESDLDGRQYTIYRDTGQGYYVYDPALGVRLVEKKNDVRAFLNLHLGVEPGTDLPTLFKSSIGVPQGTFTADFLLTPVKRKAAFDRLLKVEEYRDGAERLRDTITLIRDRVAEARERIAGAEGQLARYDEFTADHQTAQERAQVLSETLTALQVEAEARARLVAEMDEAERRVNETRARADRLAVERDAAVRRQRDLQTEVEAARRASERRRATEGEYRAHLEALDGLRLLETERAERDRLRVEAERAARAVVSAEMDVRRIEEALERAARARASLVKTEAEISAQEELERERERLRDLHAQSRAAGERLVRFDRELTSLRAQHTRTRERARAAESAEGAPEKVERLESDRLHAEIELSRVENALTAKKHIGRQSVELTREIERLRRGVASLEREVRVLEQGAAGACDADHLESRERELTGQAARLRAEIAHDEKMRAEVKGGLCPILSERCLNIGEGQTLDGYFTDQLSVNTAALAEIEKEGVRIVETVRAARAAATAVAQLERERTRLTHERELLAEREAAMTSLDRDLAEQPEASAGLLEKLQAEMTGIDLGLKTAREEVKRHAELEPLRARLREIEEEGKRKREEREEIAAVASGVDSLAADIKETEQRLRALEDPRGRAAALRVEAEREPALVQDAQSALSALDVLQAQQSALDEQLERFSGLDVNWASITATRDRTAGAYREHIESAALAATLSTREAEALSAAESAAESAADAEEARAAHAEAVDSYQRERHNTERGQLSLARERAAATAAQLEAAREREAKLAEEIALLDEVRERMRDEFRAKERLEEVHEATDFVRDILKQAGPLVTESYLYNISIEANQLFREITGEGGRALRWSKDYEIILEEGGYERPFMNLSGGEQMVAAMAVRLALLKQLSDIRIAFFDEPTVNMDAERRERLAQQIGQVRHFDQLFVISHDDTFEESVDHVITIARVVEEAA
ncbi:MAG: SMC family ATPase [Acidobacteriota bacterium]|nr:SMC family ATPase [Acidobacteriota bacterium]